ncbi:MAG TPA: LptF/LptG family permease [Myxococcota bacterium]
MAAGSESKGEAARAARALTSGHRPLGWTLFGYIAREAVLPSLLALGGLSLAALTKSLLGLSDLLVNRGLSGADTAAFVGFEIVVLAARILPFAVLLGALIALGRLAADKELLALESCGISPGRLIGPVLAVGCLGTLGGLALSLQLVPATLAAREQLLIRSTLEQPGSVLHPGVVQKFKERRLSALDASSRGDDLRGVMLHAEDLDETFFSETATLRVPQPGTIVVTMRDGMIVTNAGKRAQLVRFKLFRIELEGKESVGKPQGDEGRFASTPTRELWSAVPQNAEDERAIRSELARRFSMPFAALALTWLAVPLALTLGSGTRGGGGVVGLGVTVVYYGLLQASNGLLEFPDVPVALAAWFPNLAAAIGGGVLMIRRFVLLREQQPRARAADARDVKSQRARGGRRWALTRYVARRYLGSALLGIGVLLLAYLLVDVLEKLEQFAEHGAAFSEVLRFYAARLPLLVSRVLPMGLLVAAAMIVSAMSSEGELVGMEACGIRAGRGLVPVIVLAALAMPPYFALLDRVLPTTNALADRLKEREIKDRAPDGWEEVWSHTARMALHVGALNAAAGMARDLTLYELGPTGLPERRLDARVASALGHGEWRLTDAKLTLISRAGLIEAPAGETRAIPEIESSLSDPMHLDIADLEKHIREAKQGGYSSMAYEVDLQSRLSQPLQCLLLPWLGLLIALGVRKPAPSLLWAIAIGVGFILVTGVSVALGYGGTIPPIAAGWLPSGAVGLAAFVLQLRR